MDYPDLNASNFKEKSIGLDRGFQCVMNVGFCREY